MAARRGGRSEQNEQSKARPSWVVAVIAESEGAQAPPRRDWRTGSTGGEVICGRGGGRVARRKGWGRRRVSGGWEEEERKKAVVGASLPGRRRVEVQVGEIA
jgi:hypothetical protein